jgi:hypothetical protein
MSRECERLGVSLRESPAHSAAPLFVARDSALGGMSLARIVTELPDVGSLYAATGRRGHTEDEEMRPGPQEGVVMNALQLLKNEHEKAKRAFGDIRAAGADQRAQLWRKLEPELKVHEEIEEAALYGPVAQDVASNDQKLREWQEHHHEEVGEAEELIQEIDGLEPTDDEWLEKIEELQTTLEHHIDEEEGEIWPRIEQAWDRSKLEQAGRQMETLKQQKMSRAA